MKITRPNGQAMASLRCRDGEMEEERTLLQKTLHSSVHPKSPFIVCEPTYIEVMLKVATSTFGRSLFKNKAKLVMGCGDNYKVELI